MPSNPIARANGRFQIKWTFDGPQSITLDSVDDARLLHNWLKARGDEVRRDDERILFGEYRYGEQGAADLAERHRNWSRVVDLWLEKKKIEVGEDTYRQVMGVIDRYTRNPMINDWSKRSISKLGAADLNALYFLIRSMPNDYARNDSGVLAKSTVAHIMAKVVEVFRWANANGWTPFNPTVARVAKALKFPTVKPVSSKGRGGLSRAQADRLIATMPNYQDQLTVRLMLATAARIGEVFALSVGCLDLDAEIPTVLFSSTMKGSRRKKGTKGERADYGSDDGEERQRVVIGDAALVAELRQHIAGRGLGEPLFPYQPAARGRRSTSVWRNPATWRNSVFLPAVARLQAEGDFPAATPHWTRHTTATWLRHKFNNQSLVQVQMRHADTRSSRPYFHQTEENRRIIHDAMAQLAS